MSPAESKFLLHPEVGDPDVASTFCLEVRVDRLERKLSQYRRMLVGALSTLVMMSIWAVFATMQSRAFVERSTQTPSPTTTALTKIPDYAVGYHMHDKRFFWYIGAALWTGNQIYSFYGLATSCAKLAKKPNALHGLGCIWSVISTAATIIGLGHRGISKIGKVAVEIGQGIQEIPLTGIPRRDVSAITAYNEAAKSAFPNLDYTLDGFIYPNSSFNGHLVPEGYDAWPVNSFTNHHGHKIHHVVIPQADGRLLNRLGVANLGGFSMASRSTAGFGFKGEHFTSGAVDFTSCNGGLPQFLNTGDFNKMESEIKCYVPNLKGHGGLKLQVYDATEGETIGSGSIAAVGPKGQTVFRKMPTCPSGIKATGCGKKKPSI